MSAREQGILYICGTPIGNLDDLTRRQVATLSSVDLIACEDTRRTIKLLNHLEIKKSMESLHEHNERDKADYLVHLMEEGRDIALVSDAGMPAISDPGAYLVERAAAAGIEVIAVPGPTAFTSALVVSGLPPAPFVFEGFLPKKKKERRARLNELVREERTLVFYEAPHRLVAALEDMAGILGNGRKACAVRELTKVHEEKVRGSLQELAHHFQANQPRGEFVLVVAGGEMVEEVPWEGLSVLEHLQLMIDAGYPKKDAIKQVAKERNLPKRKVYQEAIQIEAKR